MTKHEIRVALRRRLAALPEKERLARSRAIQKKFLAHPAFLASSCVCFYVSLPSEADTAPLIDRALALKKTVLVPLADLENKALELYRITSRSRLGKGPFGVREPRASKRHLAEASDCDLVIVPGIAFDRSGRRIGRGLGFYDRLLARAHPGAFKLGLAFRFQVVPRIPTESHDIRLEAALTD